jgi:hypothetical protein
MLSRYATSTFLAPDPASSGEQFVDSIASELGARYASCALVSTDAALWALSRWRGKLPDAAVRILPPHASVARVLDSSRLSDLARSVDVSCIDTLRFEPGDSLVGLEDAVNKLGMPIWVRPLMPWIEREDGSRRVVENRVVWHMSELIALLSHPGKLFDKGCIIEHRPKGRYVSFAAVCDKGVPIAQMCQERFATLVRTIAIEPEMQRMAHRLLGALCWQGPAKVEMIQLESGAFRVVRVIGHLWGSMQLAIDAGVDVPLLCYRLTQGAWRPKSTILARPGIEMHWMLGDVKDMFQWKDPVPFLYELQQVARSKLKLHRVS